PALAGDLSCDVHRGDGAADGKDRNRRVVLQVPAAARRGCDADEGANLEAALTGVAIGVGIRIRQKRPLVIAHPAIEQLPIPGFVDLSRVGRRGPMRPAPPAHPPPPPRPPPPPPP